MTPICCLNALSPSVQLTADGLIGLVNEVLKTLPKTKLVAFSICPEVQPPSIASPNGGMAYVGVAVIQLESEVAFAKLMDLLRDYRPPAGATMRVVK